MKTPEPLQWPNIEELIDNKMYRNRYRKLCKDGYLVELHWLAKVARSKEEPSHWFAYMCGTKRWEYTLKYIDEYITWEECESIKTDIERAYPGLTPRSPSPHTP